MTTKTWKCDVCGYIHSGPEAPDNCPVCGVDKSLFSVFEVAATPKKESSTRWKCTICEYVHEGDSPPEVCPICAAGKSMFKPEEPKVRSSTSDGVGHLVIVGGGVAAVTAAENARNAKDNVRITVISKETERPYYRLNLTRYLAGEIGEDALPLKSEKWYAEQNIAVQSGEVVRIDRDAKVLHLRDETTVAYDRLILANGAHPFVPPFPGVQKSGVCVFRSMEDAAGILRYARKGARCVCIGGGLLGLEAAGALVRRGMDVTVVEGFGWLLPRQLPEQAGEMLRRNLEAQGIRVQLDVVVEGLLGDEAVSAVKLKSGEELPADLVVISTGVRPNSYLARQCGLKVGYGVVVNDRLLTSDPNVFAAGDVAEHRGRLYGIWPASYSQGAVAGTNAVGGELDFVGIPPSNRLKVMGTDLFSIGMVRPEDASYDVHEVTEKDTYYCLVVRDGRLFGAALYGDTSEAGRVQEAVESGRQLKDWPELLERYPCLTKTSTSK